MPTQFEMNEANLAKVFDPINQTSDRRLQLTLSDIGRQQQIEDDDKRQAKAEDRQRARRVLDAAISMGIKIPEGASDEKIGELVRTHKEKIANSTLKHNKAIFQSERDQINKRREELEKKKDSIISENLSPEDKASILRSLISNPEYAGAMRKESQERVIKALASGGSAEQIDKLISDISSDIKSNKFLFWGKGGEKVAQAFMQAYSDTATAALTQSKQADLLGWMEEMKALSNDSRAISKDFTESLRGIIKEHGGYISDDVVKQVTSEINQVEAPTTTGKVDAGALSIITKAGTEPAAEPQPNAPAKPATQSLSEKIDDRGLVGVVQDFDPNTVPFVGAIPAGINAFIPGTRQNAVVAEGLAALPSVAKNLIIGGRTSAPTQADIAAGRSARDARLGYTPVSPLGKLKADREMLAGLSTEQHAAIRQGAISMGMTPEQIAAGDQLIKSGDLSKQETQNAINSALLILRVMSGNIGELPTVQAPGLAPLPQ